MFKKSNLNPFLTADKNIPWESQAVFNPCVVKDNDTIHLFYRAMGNPEDHQGAVFSISSIGYATSKDGFQFTKQGQFIKPEHGWEFFGCEDPRITKLGEKYYIFYTALSAYPFNAGGIKVGVAISKDLKHIDAKHPVTTFNAKAMALFPEKINEKFVAIVTANTDLPPAKIAVAFFDKEEDIWSPSYWNDWYSNLNHHVVPLLRSPNDHLEVGAPPVKTKEGWLLIYSYIQNYFSSNPTFGIEAVLLDLQNPLKVIARTKKPFLIPDQNYEMIGQVPKVIFPSGAMIHNEDLYVYYGGADTNCCVAIGNLNDLLTEMKDVRQDKFTSSLNRYYFQRYQQNPIITPRPEFAWEAQCTFNPTAIYENGQVHIIYRAMSSDYTSSFGYASSSDGIHIDERLPEPIYVPKEFFELKLKPGNSGVEDPRITKFGDQFYIFYTAYDGYMPRIAFTSIKVKDFLNKNWNWARAKRISCPTEENKNSCLLPKKINNKFAIFHRANNCIYLNYVENLNFLETNWLKKEFLVMKPDTDAKIPIEKVGISATPIEIHCGWILFYHFVTIAGNSRKYHVGVALLDLNDPSKIIKKYEPLLSPEVDYEIEGFVSNVVFPCGAIILDKDVFLYYGAADKVIGVAKLALKQIYECLEIT